VSVLCVPATSDLWRLNLTAYILAMHLCQICCATSENWRPRNLLTYMLCVDAVCSQWLMVTDQKVYSI